MKKSLLTFFLLLLVSAPAIAAVPQSMVGGSGLGLMRTAEVLGPGESSWFMNGMSSEYDSYSNPGSSALGIQGTLGYARSFGGHTEISFLFPYAWYSSDTGSSYAGNRGVTGIIKHSFTEPVSTQGSAFAFTLLYTLQPGQASTNVTSGQNLHSFELNYSHWAETTGFHLNLGYGLLDKWDGSSLPPFVATEMYTGSMGVEVGLSDAMTFSLQLLGQNIIATSDQNLLSSAVFTYSVSKHTVFTFGGAWGIPSNRSRPNTTYMFGISYSPQAKRRGRYKIKDSNEKLAEQNVQILTKVDGIGQRIDNIGQQVDEIDQRVGRLENTLVKKPVGAVNTPSMPPMKPIAKATAPPTTVAASPNPAEAQAKGLRVELLATKHDHKQARLLENILTKAGYRVVLKPEAMSSKPKQSHVIYREGLGDDAVALGHKLKGNQIVVKGELPKGVDIRLQVGRDLAP